MKADRLLKYLKFPVKGVWIAESVLLFILIICAARLFDVRLTLGAQLSFHPFWIPILLMGSRYGFGPGAVCGLVSAVLQILLTSHGIPTRTHLEVMAESGELISPILFVVLGVGIGGIRQHYIDKEYELNQDLSKLSRMNIQIKEDLAFAENSKKQLEARIVGETRTIRTLYDSAIKLESRNLSRIREGCLEIFKKNFGVNQASYFIVEGGDLVLAASIGWDEGRKSEARVSLQKSILKYGVHSE